MAFKYLTKGITINKGATRDINKDDMKKQKR
jgi:hypothetical protein